MQKLKDFNDWRNKGTDRRIHAVVQGHAKVG